MKIIKVAVLNLVIGYTYLKQSTENFKATVGFNPISPPERKRPYKQSKPAHTGGRDNSIVHTQSSASKVTQRSTKLDKKVSGAANRPNRNVTAWR